MAEEEVVAEQVVVAEEVAEQVVVVVGRRPCCFGSDAETARERCLARPYVRCSCFCFLNERQHFCEMFEGPFKFTVTFFCRHIEQCRCICSSTYPRLKVVKDQGAVTSICHTVSAAMIDASWVAYVLDDQRCPSGYGRT